MRVVWVGDPYASVPLNKRAVSSRAVGALKGNAAKL